MTGDEDAGEDVGDIVDKAVARADTGRETFRALSVDDRFRKTVRDDHAPNAALHDALRAAAEDDDRIHSVNLIGSHAPGNRHKGEPRYHVRVDVRNDGMGHPVLGATVAGRMVDQGNVRITDVVECSDDHLVVALRPIQTRVEPIDVPVRDIPDRFVDADTLLNDAVAVFEKAAADGGVPDSAIRPVARALATVVYTVNPERFNHEDTPPEAAPSKAHDELWERADVDREDHKPAFCVTEVGGEAWSHDPIEGQGHAARIAMRLLEEHVEPPTPNARLTPDGWEWVGPQDERTAGLSAPLDFGSPAFEQGAIDPDAFDEPATTEEIERFRDAFDAGYERPDVITGPMTSEDFVPYSRRRAGRSTVHVAVQDRDTGDVVAEFTDKAGEWVKTDTGRGIYNVRVDVGAEAGKSAKPVTAYVCHGCERKTLPEDFRVPSCSCDHADGDACDECGGVAGPRCPRCGTAVDWDKTAGVDE